jgi:uncharacterized membrane protein SpoIIM required for sporulation
MSHGLSMSLLGRFPGDVRRLLTPGRTFVLLFALLFVTVAMGAAAGFALDPSSRREVVTAFEASTPDRGAGYLSLFLELFVHNFLIGLGILGAGLWLRYLPPSILAFNGLAIGLFLCCYAEGSAAGTLMAFAWCMPHGVFELTSFVAVTCLALHVNSWKRRAPPAGLGPDDLRWAARCVWYVAIFDFIAASIEAGLIVGLR